MVIKNYTSSVQRKSTPQTEPIPGTNQVPNSAGGFTFGITRWSKLDRFLILGSEGGSYYATEKVLTRENAESVIACIKEDGVRVVNQIVKVSDEGRAPKNDPAIFALGLCLKLGDEKTRKAAQENVTKVCRIGTHIMQLAEVIKSLGGWGRGTKTAISNFYTKRTPDQLANQLVKYQSRGGWSNKDLLRKVHIKPISEEQKLAFKWAVGKLTEDELKNEKLPRMIFGFEEAKKADNEKKLVKLIEEYELPREAVPTQFLNSPAVWKALLTSGGGMPFTALVRNLAKMTSIELLKPLSEMTKFVVNRLGDAEGLKKARVHPINVLVAMRTYSAGHGDKGSLKWNPVPQIEAALDDAFYHCFKLVEPTGKNFLLGLDVSGSMSSPASGISLQCREVTAAMAMVASRVEKNSYVFGFTNRFEDLKITPNDTIAQAMKKAEKANFGSTDCAQPMLYAMQNKLDVDMFCVYTDSETYAGNPHPSQALKQYREKTGRAAKMMVLGIVSNGFSIADPNDAGMMDVVGFDTSIPQVMADFAKK